jgi:DNA-binding CsgD family transcriptional regulator
LLDNLMKPMTYFKIPINSKIIYFLFLSFFLHPYLINAQVKNIGLPEITNYKKSDYTGGTQNWGIEQDKNGNLYFANNEGLFQFDGSSWNNFKLPNNSSIRALKIGNNGRIYVGGYNEFGYFQPDRKGKLVYFSISKKINSNNVKLIDFTWKIHILRDEVLFQSFGSLYIFKDEKLTIIEAPNRFQFSFLVNDKIYIQDIGLGLISYSEGKLAVVPETQLFNDTEIWGIVTLQKKKLLVATLDKGLFIIDNNIVTPWQSEATNFVKKNSSLGATIIKKDFIVINSVLDGIIICDMNGKIVQHINRKKGLQNNTVLTSYVDDNSNLWLGLDNGIAFINENSPFTYFGFSYDLSTVYSSAVFEKNLYVATNQGVFYHTWDIPFKEDSFTLVKGTTGQAWNIQIIDDILICSHNRGAFQISGDKIIKTFDTKGYWGFKKIPDQSNLMIGSNYNGFAVFEKSASGWNYKNQIEGFTKSASTFEVEPKSVWLKKDQYVYQLRFNTDLKKFNYVKTYESLDPSLDGIRSIQKLQNTLYFQTKNRFFKYSNENDSFSEDKNMTSLFKNIPTINYCFEDNYGNICYTFAASIGMLLKTDGGEYQDIRTPFSNLSGNLVFNYESVNTINAKNMFIGLTEGLAHYDSKLPTIISKPKVFIKSFSSPNDTLIIGNLNSKIDVSIPFKSNSVTFRFSSPTYENTKNIQFSYKLEGFDENWSKWTSISIKEYTNLVEGNYEMQVKVRNSYGIESNPAKFSFTILPPFYRHFLAYLFYVCLIGLAFFLIRQRIKLKIRKNKYYETVEQRRLYLEKEAKIKQDQFELEKEIERLNNEKLKIKILAKDKELVNNSLQVVKKNKILNGIIHKLKDIDSEVFDDAAKTQFLKLNKSIVKEVNADKSWKDLEKHIKNVHFDFLKRLKERHPTISPRELDLSTYLLMNMSTKEIAEIMNISSGGVELARYRLRKKLGLNKKENLIGYLMGI